MTMMKIEMANEDDVVHDRKGEKKHDRDSNRKIIESDIEKEEKIQKDMRIIIIIIMFMMTKENQTEWLNQKNQKRFHL